MMQAREKKVGLQSRLLNDKRFWRLLASERVFLCELHKLSLFIERHIMTFRFTGCNDLHCHDNPF